MLSHHNDDEWIRLDLPWLQFIAPVTSLSCINNLTREDLWDMYCSTLYRCMDWKHCTVSRVQTEKENCSIEFWVMFHLQARTPLCKELQDAMLPYVQVINSFSSLCFARFSFLQCVWLRNSWICLERERKPTLIEHLLFSFSEWTGEIRDPPSPILPSQSFLPHFPSPIVEL